MSVSITLLAQTSGIKFEQLRVNLLADAPALVIYPIFVKFEVEVFG